MVELLLPQPLMRSVRRSDAGRIRRGRHIADSKAAGNDAVGEFRKKSSAAGG
jgi:hypothetical protein